MPSSSLPDHTASGGASTSHGILVQALWTLYRFAPAGRARIICSDDSNENVQIIVEPRDGGDLALITKTFRIVEQIKSRPDGGTWSFTEFVTDVLADLFKATAAGDTQSRFRFVTNGRIGAWSEIRALIESLKERTFDVTLIGLNNETSLGIRQRKGKKLEHPARDSFDRSTSGDSKKVLFAIPDKPTERTVFTSIASFLCQRSVSELGIDELHRVWRFLAAVEIESEVDFAATDAVIDAWLAGQVEAIETRPEVKKTLLASLWQKASRGNEVVDCDTLLRELGLNGMRLSNWHQLITKNRAWLMHEFDTCRFVPSEDVRRDFADEVLETWQADRPVLVLVGESGQGKSWLANSLLHKSLLRFELAWRVDSTGDPQSSVQAAADVFWHELVGQDIDKPLSRIRPRFRELYPDYEDRIIRVLFDNVTDAKEAVAIAKLHWKEWGIRVVITCRHDVGEAIQAQAGSVCTLRDVPDFNEPELREYLDRSFGESWPSIPLSIRDTLRRPLLANLYRDLATETTLSPNSEYALYSQVWSRITSHPEMVDSPTDVVKLGRLIGMILDGATYPWPVALVAQHLDNGAIVRLERIGWLSKTTNRSYRIWHDRLLNWGMAECLWADLLARNKCRLEVCALVKPLLQERRGSVFWGYVPMDLLWLATTHTCEESDEFVDTFLIELETVPACWNHEIYSTDVASLGNVVVPALFRRVVAAALNSEHGTIRDIAKAVARIAEPSAHDRIAGLLGHASPQVQRAGMILIYHFPSGRHLDRLWQLHCDLECDRKKYAWSFEGEHTHGCYSDSMNALRNCVPESPIWITNTVHRKGGEKDPIWDLAYLIAGLTEGRVIWHECRDELFVRLATEHPRCLALNCGCWRDTGKTRWLIENVANRTDQTASTAFHALTLIDANLAIENLHLVDTFETYLSRGWWLPRLLILHQNKLIEALTKQIRELEPEKASLLLRVFQDFEDEMPSAVVDLLLDQVLAAVQLANANRGLEEKHRNHMIEFGMLVKVARRDSLECFRMRRGTELEFQLRDWLLSIGPPNSIWHSAEHSDGLSLIARIGGEGFTAVLNHWMDSGEYWGRWSCWRLAGRRPDVRTIELLERRTQSTEPHPGSEHVIEDSDAAEALAAFGDWDGVCRYVRKAACNTNSLVAEFQADQIEVSEDLLQELRDADPNDPGVIMAMGFTGQQEFLAKISDVIRRASPDSNLALGCALALEDLRDQSPNLVPFLDQMLATAQNSYAATRALFSNGTSDAIECLAKYCQSEPWFNDEGAYSSGGIWLLFELLRHPIGRNACIAQVRLLLREINAGTVRSFAAENLLEFLSHLTIGDPIACELLQEAEVESFVYRDALSFGVLGIRLLRNFDIATAAIACKAALSNRGSKDRHRYPQLLVECDPEHAAEWLANHSSSERTSRVLWAIGRALMSTQSETVIEKWKRLREPPDLAAVCHSLAFQSPEFPVDEWLLSLLESHSQLVRDSAAFAIRKRRQQATLLTLIDECTSQTDLPFKWVMLEAISQLADPGDEGCGVCPWMSKICEAMPRSMLHWLDNALTTARKELLKESEKWDKRFKSR